MKLMFGSYPVRPSGNLVPDRRPQLVHTRPTRKDMKMQNKCLVRPVSSWMMAMVRGAGPHQFGDDRQPNLQIAKQTSRQPASIGSRRVASTMLKMRNKYLEKTMLGRMSNHRVNDCRHGWKIKRPCAVVISESEAGRYDDHRFAHPYSA